MTVDKREVSLSVASTDIATPRSRRCVLWMSVVALVATSAAPKVAFCANPQKEAKRATVRWRLPRHFIEKVRESTQFEGQTIPDESSASDTRGLPLFYILIGSVVVPYLAEAMIALYRDVTCGAMIARRVEDGWAIDCEPRRDASEFIIVDTDGLTVQVFDHMPSPENLMKLLEVVK